uniref:Uncharacterized protein n=1 Tax=Parascaris equorum TaxID=6256 RepID=A0A914RRG8_PAREQ
MACLSSLRGDRPQAVSIQALWQGEKELALHRALTAYREPLIQRPEMQFVCSHDLTALELLLYAMFYIALEVEDTKR